MGFRRKDRDPNIHDALDELERKRELLHSTEDQFNHALSTIHDLEREVEWLKSELKKRDDRDELGD